MKKWVVFCLGIITGIVITILFALLTVNIFNPENGIKWFEKAGDTINETSFRVLQVIGNNKALVQNNSSSPVYLLTNEEGKYYYDDEHITVSSDKEVKQIGIFKYNSKADIEKTVPVIMIMDK
jgi:hypothetical protein